MLRPYLGNPNMRQRTGAGATSLKQKTQNKPAPSSKQHLNPESRKVIDKFQRSNAQAILRGTQTWNTRQGLGLHAFIKKTQKKLVHRSKQHLNPKSRKAMTNSKGQMPRPYSEEPKHETKNKIWGYLPLSKRHKNLPPNPSNTWPPKPGKVQDLKHRALPRGT